MHLQCYVLGRSGFHGRALEAVMIRTSALALAPLFLITSLLLGAQTYELRSGPRTPGARGTVGVETEPDGNHRITLEVSHVPAAARIDPSLSSLVVWLQGSGGGRSPVSVGVLEVDKDLNGKIQLTTPLRSFAIYVTAEPSPAVTQPGKTVVLEGTLLVPQTK
jgi:hypothetical protein